IGQRNGSVGCCKKLSQFVEGPRRLRSDAKRLDGELQQSVRDFYEITAPIFRRLQLVRTAMTERTDTGLRYEIEKLSGSDPTFQRQKVELEFARSPNSHTLAFWMNGTRT